MNNAIKLEKHIEINVMWNLVMEGKFQKCISRSELIGNLQVNKIIEQVLVLYKKEFANDGWDIRDLYIEDTFYKDFIEKYLSLYDYKDFLKIEDKIKFIKDIAYPYKVKEETIEKIIKLKINGSLTSTFNTHEENVKNGIFKLKTTVSAPWQGKSIDEEVVDYEIILSGKATDEAINSLKLEINRKKEI